MTHQADPYGQPPGSQTVDPRAYLASRWARLGGAIVDGLVIGVLGAVITFPLVDWGRIYNSKTGDWAYHGDQVPGNLLAVVIGIVYYWFMQARWGQTLGKMLVGTRVVREEDGGAIGPARALGRAAFYNIALFVCCFGVIDVLWILWDDRRQALHDKAAHTLVIKADLAPNPYAASRTRG